MFRKCRNYERLNFSSIYTKIYSRKLGYRSWFDYKGKVKEAILFKFRRLSNICKRSRTSHPDSHFSVNIFELSTMSKILKSKIVRPKTADKHFSDLFFFDAALVIRFHDAITWSRSLTVSH